MAHNARVQRVCEGKCGEVIIHLLCVRTQLTTPPPLLNPSLIHYPSHPQNIYCFKTLKTSQVSTSNIAYPIDAYNEWVVSSLAFPFDFCLCELKTN
jgi:hypothetical protein